MQNSTQDQSTLQRNDIDLTAPNPRQDVFQSDIFTVIVGDRQKRFTVHRDILTKSPTLRGQCNGSFKEAKTQIIRLPDEHHESFALLLEFLYSGDYWPRVGKEFDQVKPRGGEAQYNLVHRNAKMYLLGDYYQLEELQALAVSKIAMLVPIALPTFLGVAEHIYENTATGGPFRRYFCDQIEKLLPEVASESSIQDLVAKGGDLATDLFLVGRRPKQVQSQTTPSIQPKVWEAGYYDRESKLREAWGIGVAPTPGKTAKRKTME